MSGTLPHGGSYIKPCDILIFSFNTNYKLLINSYEYKKRKGNIKIIL